MKKVLRPELWPRVCWPARLLHRRKRQPDLIHQTPLWRRRTPSPVRVTILPWRQRRMPDDTAAPAKGSNSFTEAQAKDRIGQRGYSNVSDLRKDDAGVWRGHAQHSGSNVQVWLDYKGNVGETP